MLLKLVTMMSIKKKDFSFWENQGYVPTARLHSWPAQWYNVQNLRFFGSITWVAAVPHDIESRIRLEYLHESIIKHKFFDPFVYENGISSSLGRRNVYVSLIPKLVVDWFSKHTLEEIHDQIAMYISLYEIGEKYSNPNVIKDTHSSYHSAIQYHLNSIWDKYPQLNKAYLFWGPHDLFEKEEFSKEANYGDFFRQKTEIEENWRQNNPHEAQIYDEKWDDFWTAWAILLEDIYKAGKLPSWFIKRNEWKNSDNQSHTYISLPRLRHDENMGWIRPTGTLADDFGIVSYGLTYYDELRLRGEKVEYDKQTGKEFIKKLTSKELEDIKSDSLCRTEASSKAFEFLMYAKSTKNEWAKWSIAPVKHNGYIYLYSDGRAIKVGFSSEHPDQEKRKLSLQTGNSGELKLVGYIEGNRAKERILHKRFEHKKTVGEWFDLNEDDIKSILGNI